MVEIKTFDIASFSLDVYRHRTELKLSRMKYAAMLGYTRKGDPIREIENREKETVQLNIAWNICQWMGKDINQYFK